ncbi:MAG: hypothetical protein U0271_02640 [Polyangiaceae bacterium]
MTPMLDDFIPEPQLVEVDYVDVLASPQAAYEAARQFDVGQSRWAHAFFALRALSSSLGPPEVVPERLAVSELATAGSGFVVLEDLPSAGFVVGAIGKLWKPQIEFAEASREGFAAFAEPGFAKVAWAVRFEPRGSACRIAFELRVTATDERAWRTTRRYLRIIGPFSRWVRRHVLSVLAKSLGSVESDLDAVAMPGDELISNITGQLTHSVSIRATPEAVWPWLVQMGCHRAGWYSYDLLDNGGAPSSWELQPELQRLSVGDQLRATPSGEETFEVLRLEPQRELVLGGLFDVGTRRQLPFASARPKHFWQATWSFLLERIDAHETRLTVRSRAAFDDGATKLRALFTVPIHRFMETRQLANLKLRAEGKAHDSWTDVAEGVVGALAMLFDFATPFLRSVRSHWGLTVEEAARVYPGDQLIEEPSWMWTHGIEIDAPVEETWAWVAQVGQGKAGFYSYQWLENLAGCNVQNAEHIHPEWRPHWGEALRLHPSAPPLSLVEVRSGPAGDDKKSLARQNAGDPLDSGSRYLVAYGGGPEGRSDIGTTWLFYVEPRPNRRSRFISRFRIRYPNSWRERLAYGPYVTESIGFVMDRRMLLGVKLRAEGGAALKASELDTDDSWAWL